MRFGGCTRAMLAFCFASLAFLGCSGEDDGTKRGGGEEVEVGGGRGTADGPGGYVRIETAYLGSAGDADLMDARVRFGGEAVWPDCFLVEGPTVEAMEHAEERGGKAPLIVLDDADLDVAVCVLAVFLVLAVFMPPGLRAAIFVGVAVGAACGALPYYLGRGQNERLARLSVVACAAVGGTLTFYLAIPLAVGLAVFLLVKGAEYPDLPTGGSRTR